MQCFDITQLLKSLPESLYPSPISTKPHAIISPPRSSVENALIKSIIRDDRENLAKSCGESEPLDRGVVSKLLYLCCEFDSANVAAVLINGEIGGVVPLINEIDGVSGFSPLHTAAENHSLRCIELLLRKRARTDLKTKAGSGMLALELALRCSRSVQNLFYNANKNKNNVVFVLFVSARILLKSSSSFCLQLHIFRKEKKKISIFGKALLFLLY